MKNYPGTRWYKCDLHLHTMASECFEDKTVTSEQWIARAVEQGLNCIAVTDHNTGAGIDAVIEAAKDQPITIFPGVEITCDSSKVHLLIIFDKDKRARHVEAFLSRCEIDLEDFGKKEAHTSLGILDIIKKAGQDCLVIPAHVDQFSGLCEISHASIQDIYKIPSINAVQVVHQEFLQQDLQITGNTELQGIISSYYGQEISEEKLKNWYKPLSLAQKKNKALLTFSDNPQSSTSSKHGLDGIGQKYTWIKMEETPTLESLRQSFLLPGLRIRNCFDCIEVPYSLPEIWIRHIAIHDTEVTSDIEPLLVEFSPQLNTIIGGRGSGKSGILRFIRGLLNKTSDIADDIQKDHEEFYKKSHRGVGVIREDSTIEILFERQEKLYCLMATNITSTSSQKVTIHKYTPGVGWEAETGEGYIDFFEIEQYSQKQIYEIAKNPHYLRERIDSAVEDMESLLQEKETLRQQYLQIATKIRTAESQLQGKGKLETEINDLAERIKIFDESEIAPLLTANKKFNEEKNVIQAPIDEFERQEQLLEDIIPEILVPDNDFSEISDEDHRKEIKEAYNLAKKELTKIKEKIVSSQEKIQHVKKGYEAAISKTTWQRDFSTNQDNFRDKKAELLEKGIDEIDNFEKLSSEKEEKEEEAKRLSGLETQLHKLKEDLNKTLEKNIATLENITEKRKQFVMVILKGENVQISINGFRDQDSFEQQFRSIIERESGFEKDINTLKTKLFRGKIVEKIKEYRTSILALKKGDDLQEFGGYFRNRIKELRDEAIDHLLLLMPEDEIAVKYKPTGSSTFKPLTTASAGQKTTAILTFIMSHGKCPLILDQPEDDLDNRLVYELVVDRLKKAKERRQIIVVTHNANIPVNGDAEHVISMDSNSKHFNVLAAGSVDQQPIKKEICDVMEGTEYAFNMRAKRYKGLSA